MGVKTRGKTMVENITDVKQDAQVPDSQVDAEHQTQMTQEQLQSEVKRLSEITSNLNAALKESRGQSKSEVERLNEQLAIAHNQLQILQKAKESSVEDGMITIGDSDWIDGKTFKNGLDLHGRKVEERFIKLLDEIERTNLDRRMYESEERAIEKHKDEPEGLDYVNVFKKCEELCKINPGYWSVIRYSSNPAEAAYKIGLTHPDLELKKDELNKQKLLGNIDKTKATTLKAGGGKTSISIDQYSPQELIDMGMKNPAMLEKLARER